MHQNGADIRSVQVILGNEKLDTTQIYTRVALANLLKVHGATHPGGERSRRVSELCGILCT
jgi:integrase/recombinase XerD